MRRYALATGLLACLPLSAWAYQAEPTPQPRKVLTVNHYTDDEAEGSLRWAITLANQAPGMYRIEIAAVGAAPYVIKPTKPLPEIKGPVAIIGLPWQQGGQYVAVDGSAYVTGAGTKACPGAVPGQYGTNVRTTTLPGLVLRDTQGVELAGLEVRNFCIGVLINRTSASELHDNRIVANKGGAGVMLTGDDGNGQSTPTTTMHNRVVRNEFIDNGDGLELTRGAAWNLVADNVFRSTQANPEPSQGIEILWGNDNTVVHNRFEDYSDGLQINWGNRNFISANTFTGNSIGVSLSGRDNLVDGNTFSGNGIGVGVRPQPTSLPNRISANLFAGNGLKIERCQAGGACVPGQLRGAIVFGVPGLEHAIFVGSRGIGVDQDDAKKSKICRDLVIDNCQPVPNGGIVAPVVDGARHGGKILTVSGHFRGTPSTVHRIEVFGNAKATDDEAAQFLGSISVATDSQGLARFSFSTPDVASVAGITATVTGVDGATSPLSAPHVVGR